MSGFQVKLLHAQGAMALEDWDGAGVPPDDFVVARHEDGTVASRYGDLIWNLTAYHAHKKSTVLTFAVGDASRSPTESELARGREMRWLIFLHMWCRPVPLATQTLCGYVSGYRIVARFAVERATTLQEVLCSESRLADLRRVYAAVHLPKINATLAFLHSLGPQLVGYDVVVGDTLRKMQAAVRAYQADTKQHPPLPTRVYAHLLCALNAELEAFDRIAEQVLVGLADRLRVRAGTAEGEPPLACPPDVADYLRTRRLQVSPSGLCTALKQVQLLAKLQVQAYCGMRDQEAHTLPYGCLKVEEADGRPHDVVHGWTTKFNRGKRQRAKWVTSREGVAAIGLARRIADFVYGTIGVQPDDASPLFVTVRYLPVDKTPLNWTGGLFHFGNLISGAKARERQLQVLLPQIAEEDLQELEYIDPHRAWRAEPEFSLGSFWPFSSHQLRRSLALYAQRSGLVSLPALKRQLQHITEEMSRYYARGSAFAADFLKGQKDHIGHDWQDAEPVSSALSYILNVVYSDEVLFGGHAQWVETHLRDAQGTVLLDREATIQRFKKGEMAYRETILGGCTNTVGCESAAINVLDIDCVGGCRNLVGRLSRLERVITVQKRFVAALEPGTVEHATEAQDLQVLLEARERALSKRKEVA